MKALRFLCQDGGTLCSHCAITEDTTFGSTDCPDEEQWTIVGAQIEDGPDPDVPDCDHCGLDLFRWTYSDVAWDFSSTEGREP